MPRLRLFFLSLTTLFACLPAFGQPQANPPKPETARQALIEIATKGGEAWQKHLTVEVQDLIKSNGKAGAWGMAIFNSMKSESGLQSFESGEVLFVYTDDAKHTKYEVHVDNDDLAGDEDSLLLSIHASRDGKEQDDEWGIMFSHFTVSMKLQQSVWRVDKISVGAEFPVGDPKFFAKTFLKMASGEANGLSAVAGGVHVSEPLQRSAAAKPPEEVLPLLASAETLFAQQNPETGFTCSLSDLAVLSRLMQLDEQVMTGTYNGYRFALSGCEGKPAGSFQLTAEPVLARPGVKAFCTDATQNLRADDNGHGAICLAAGKVYRPLQEVPEGSGLDVVVHPPETEPKP